jgi:hypothetical protein
VLSELQTRLAAIKAKAGPNPVDAAIDKLLEEGRSLAGLS